ncbi:MAG: 30S ribosomal protein S18 [Candidatus Pacebacteria bacterium]|nr:30S ribosomal protein S18 [Candidatus Paceibacterota bacterium]
MNHNQNQNQNNIQIKRQCLFCIEKERKVDYKDPQTLRRFLSQRAKILQPKRTGACTKHQRHVANAIKRARFMGLLPYVSK